MHVSFYRWFEHILLYLCITYTKGLNTSSDNCTTCNINILYSYNSVYNITVVYHKAYLKLLSQIRKLNYNYKVNNSGKSVWHVYKVMNSGKSIGWEKKNPSD